MYRFACDVSSRTGYCVTIMEKDDNDISDILGPRIVEELCVPTIYGMDHLFTDLGKIRGGQITINHSQPVQSSSFVLLSTLLTASLLDLSIPRSEDLF